MDFDGMLAEKRVTLHELQEDIRALERVQRMSANGVYVVEAATPSPSVPGAATLLPLSLSEVRKMRTQKEALGYIADQNNGLVKVKEAKELLISSGHIKGQPKHAYVHLYNILKDDPHYVRSGKGEFRKVLPEEALQ